MRFRAALAAVLLLALSACQHDLAAPPAPETAVAPAGPVAPTDRAQAEAHFLLGRAEEASGDLAAAVASYVTALALDPWTRPVEAGPGGKTRGDKTPGDALARICESRGDPRAADRACGAIIADLDFGADRLATFHIRRAEALLALGEVDRARSGIEAAEQLDSGNPEMLLIRGRVMQASGKAAAGLRSYTLALFGRPGWPEAHLTRGRLRARLRDDSGALEDFDAVLSDPAGVAAFPAAYRDRAAVHCRLGEPEKAALGWQVWADLTPAGPAYVNEMLEARGYLRNPPGGSVAGSALAAWTRAGCP